MHVVEPILEFVPSPIMVGPVEPEVPELEAIAREITAHGVNATWELLGPRDACSAITEHARGARPADFLALATHSRSGLARLVLGSTAARVVRHAPCPVLVHHPEATRQ